MKKCPHCFDSEGDWPHSDEEGADMMDRAVNDAKVVLRDLRHPSIPAPTVQDGTP